jgi:hypothetical protein
MQNFVQEKIDDENDDMFDGESIAFKILMDNLPIDFNKSIIFF